MPFVRDEALDAKLDDIALASRLDVCDAEPTNFTEATTTNSLGNVAVTPGDGNGDFVVADEGGGDGRALTLAPQTIPGANVTSGTPVAWALTDGAALVATGPGSGPNTSAGFDYEVGALVIRAPDAIATP